MSKRETDKEIIERLKKELEEKDKLLKEKDDEEKKYKSKIEYLSEESLGSPKGSIVQNQRKLPKKRTQRNVVVIPMGCGKSLIIALTPYFLAEVMSVKRVLILTPSINIADQIFEDLHGEKIEETEFCKYDLISKERAKNLPSVTKLGSVKSGKLTSEINIFNAQKFRSSGAPEWMLLEKDSYDLVIVDEAHHYPAGYWNSVVDHFGNGYVLFLTGTPFKQDKKFDKEVTKKNIKVIFNMTREAATNLGIIREIEWILLPTKENTKENSPKDLTDDSEISTYMILREIKAQLKSIESIVLPSKRSHAALLIVGSIDEAKRAKEIAKKFLEIDAICYNSELKVNERKMIKKIFEKGNVQLMILVQSLLEGYNYQPVSIVGIARKIGKNVPTFDQFVGRALRYDRNEGEKDSLTAKVITDVYFKQQKNIESFKKEEQLSKYLNAYQQKIDEETNKFNPKIAKLEKKSKNFDEYLPENDISLDKCLKLFQMERVKIPGDGHCQFASIAQQENPKLEVNDLKEVGLRIRKSISEHLWRNRDKYQNFFVPDEVCDTFERFCLELSNGNSNVWVTT
eukprot:gene3339-5887_t